MVNEILVQNRCNKVIIELRVVQLWSEIIPLISNQARTTRSILKGVVMQTLDKYFIGS